MAVQAAGGVLWRPAGAGGGVEVALVHRPRYDDWSLPKGKLDPGESHLQAACREVAEETGSQVVVGRSLGSTEHLLRDGAGPDRKQVRWWAMRSLGGRFRPGAEVDEVAWLAPPDAVALLAAHADPAPLRRWLSGPADTATVLLVRHASAGDRQGWDGEDDSRPLDVRGRRQAEALCELLAAYGVVRVLSAPLLRCVETVRPLAAQLGLAVEGDPALSEAAHADDPTAARARVHAVAVPGQAVVLCSQGGVIPAVVGPLAASAGLQLPSVRTPKGSTWMLSSAGDTLVDVEQLPAP